MVTAFVVTFKDPVQVLFMIPKWCCNKFMIVLNHSKLKMDDAGRNSDETAPAMV
jgi:hypothetical protein